MNSPEIRQKFLEYFSKRGHTIVPSSSLIPAQDPTLLFTNAGMNQFKDVFLGNEKRSYTRATSMQKCVRAGGKHNDLDEVGFTTRHLTFFEMMGNFSFGDYFKKDAIQYAWEFLTKEMGLPADKLHASVYKEDDESYDLWRTMIGLPEERIVRCGQKDNFWAMGDTGPCGPCSEIHFDRGEQYGCGKPGCGVNCDNCSRVMEVWNLVFMQYNRDDEGTLKPLTHTGVDTGMGFERLATVTQGKDSVFEIDLFQHLFTAIEKSSDHVYAKSPQEIKNAFHVISDHVRSTCLIIADGGSPSNEGRGYVLRKIIRRAALFAQKLSDSPALFLDLAQAFINDQSSIFPELKTSGSLILKVLDSEVKRFSANLVQGQLILAKYLEQQRAKNNTYLSGEQVFKLYDTYGFPPELTRVIAGEQSFSLDMSGFEKHMQHQQAQSGKKSVHKIETLPIPEGLSTTFIGYESVENHSPITFVHATDDELWIVTKESPFYVESGGQVNDQGWVTINNHSYPVADLKKVGSGFDEKAIALKLRVEDSEHAAKIKVGDAAHSVVNDYVRINTVKNHTATHMLQAALQQILGPAVKQAGSVVEPDYLRFDYTCADALSADQIDQIETLMNAKIQENITTVVKHSTLDQAKKSGVIAFFGEKYNPEKVRVVAIPGFSAELCGGTHAPSTGIIGAFKIVSDTALSTGIRRIVAVTGPQAIKLFQQNFNTVKALSEKYKAKPNAIVAAVERQQEQLQAAQGEIKRLKKDLQRSAAPEYVKRMIDLNDVPFLYLAQDDQSMDDLKELCKELEKIKPGFYFLQSNTPGQHTMKFLGYVSREHAPKVNVRDLSIVLHEKFGVKGGGSPTLIQGSGPLGTDIREAITVWLHSK